MEHFFRRIGAAKSCIYAEAVDDHIAFGGQEDRFCFCVQMADTVACASSDRAGCASHDGVHLISWERLTRQIIGQRATGRNFGDVCVIIVGHHLNNGNEVRIGYEGSPARRVGNDATLAVVGIDDDGANLTRQCDVTSNPCRGVVEIRLVRIRMSEVEAPRDSIPCARV